MPFLSIRAKFSNYKGPQGPKYSRISSEASKIGNHLAIKYLQKLLYYEVDINNCIMIMESLIKNGTASTAKDDGVRVAASYRAIRENDTDIKSATHLSNDYQKALKSIINPHQIDFEKIVKTNGGVLRPYSNNLKNHVFRWNVFELKKSLPNYNGPKGQLYSNLEKEVKNMLDEMEKTTRMAMYYKVRKFSCKCSY